MATRPAQPPRKIPSKIGRPTKAEAKKRHEELLDAAADLFLEMGYQQATLEMIAGSVNMTKRTIYSRYADKEALFRATVARAIDRMTEHQAEQLAALETKDLRTALAETARMRMRQVMSPIGIKLQRIVAAETYRFPDLFPLANERITKPVVDFLAALLRRYRDAGLLRVERPELAATAFMSMVVGAPVRVVQAGLPIDEREMEERIEFCIDLFFRGVEVKDQTTV